MTIRTVTVEEAYEEMSTHSEVNFVDVRTVPEYEAGHPQKSNNIPWVLPDPTTGEMTPNAGFLYAMEATFPQDQTLYVSCKMGGRSLGACYDLEKAGWTDLVNIDGGFGGKRDPEGNVIAPGWVDCALPVDTNESEYEEPMEF